MPFNAEKCKHMHVGHSWPSAHYSISDVEIKNFKVEKDLGETIGCTLDSSYQCAKVASTANKVLSVINRTYKYKSQRNCMFIVQVACKTTYRILLSGLAPTPAKGH